VRCEGWAWLGRGDDDDGYEGFFQIRMLGADFVRGMGSCRAKAG
jgi:hypothetical protein